MQPDTPFSYTPNPNDPEIISLRKRILDEGRYNELGLTNDLARSNLIGTSVGIGQLQSARNDTAKSLEGVDNGVFAKRRMEALDLYNRQMDFNRQLKLLQVQHHYASQSANQGYIGDLFTSGGELGFLKLMRLI